ncbi:MAG: type II toxin-antitoxin system HicA family toxin [Corynebacterium matruchotii]|uniref:type II toxin-antitoxin system HicA family toxin n=1 Tax=Corynebacterium matruchotii TaxID=43768 RepID=UPI0036214BA4
MSKGFPTCSHRKLLKIIEKYCVRVRSKGSHVIYRSSITGRIFSYPVRSKDFKTRTVRKILVGDVGLTEEQAKEEVK